MVDDGGGVENVVPRREPRGHVLAHRGRRDQHRVGCSLLRRGVEGSHVSLVGIERELVAIGDVDGPGPVRAELLRQAGHALSGEHGGGRACAEPARERQGFEGRLADLAVALFDEDEKLHLTSFSVPGPVSSPSSRGPQARGIPNSTSTGSLASLGMI